MRKSFLLSGVLCAALCLTTAVWAVDSSKGKAKAEPANTKCPITGDDVDPAAPTTKYKGKTLIGFCCKDCVGKFAKLKAAEKDEKVKAVLADAGDSKKEDSKDSKKEEEPKKSGKGSKEQAAGKPINSKCIVHTDDAVDQTVTTVYKGKTYGFCCDDCLKKFNADPDSYVKAGK